MSNHFRTVHNPFSHPDVNSTPPIAYQPQYATLRDQFAMAALTGMCAHGGHNSTGRAAAAEEAYEYADAMMRVREGK